MNPETDRNHHSLALYRLTMRSDVGPYSLNVSNNCAISRTGLTKYMIVPSSNVNLSSVNIGNFKNSAESSARFVYISTRKFMRYGAEMAVVISFNILQSKKRGWIELYLKRSLTRRLFEMIQSTAKV
ncbi:hypothetical protein AYI69_g10611 [Smittium culicis]|uniref:Uncharacterized protein n=1 Tax=Smittium culicis TaxID=133412 RepID=A0A1R1X4I0_9FUNG|nr:hypothetical protein AYI69_g10611 [Smittium culicis]